MARLLARRVLQAVIVVWLVATITFVLLHLAPGDPLSALTINPDISESVRAHWAAAYGLDRPLGEQYLRYLGLLSHGDLGWSISQNRAVGSILGDAIPNTLLLMGVALGMSFLLGVALGVIQFARPESKLVRLVGTLSLAVYSMPDFWLATILLLCFAYWLPVFPVSGMVAPVAHDFYGLAGRWLDVARHLVLPALSLTLLTTAGVARFQRAAMVESAREDFVRTARAKGLGERSVLWRHVLRNALLPVITMLGLALPALLGGAVFVERVYSWPGMGLLLANGITQRDYQLVTGIVIVGGVTVCIGSLLADLLYAAADPRLRHG